MVLRVLVTGANGFVGRALCEALADAGMSVRAAVRSISAITYSLCGASEVVEVGSIGSTTDWSEALDGCDAVVHLAARVHQMRELAPDPLAEFREINTNATIELARQATEAGVRRLLYLSSIKVNGEGGARRYCELDMPDPRDPYAQSKWEAEQGLHQVARETGLETVILRPPLIYGPGVGANFLQLMRAVDQGWPLPLRQVHNQRSLLYLGNLMEAIEVGLSHPAAAGKTYLLADDPSVSTPELIRAMAGALRVRAWLLPLPVVVLKLLGVLSGRREAVQRLLGSLEADGSRISRELGWKPSFSLQQGLAGTAAWYRGVR